MLDEHTSAWWRWSRRRPVLAHRDFRRWSSTTNPLPGFGLATLQSRRTLVEVASCPRPRPFRLPPAASRHLAAAVPGRGGWRLLDARERPWGPPVRRALLRRRRVAGSRRRSAAVQRRGTEERLPDSPTDTSSPYCTVACLKPQFDQATLVSHSIWHVLDTSVSWSLILCNGSKKVSSSSRACPILERSRFHCPLPRFTILSPLPSWHQADVEWPQVLFNGTEPSSPRSTGRSFPIAWQSRNDGSKNTCIRSR